MNEKISKEETIRELTIALMYLNRFSDQEGRPFNLLAWKGYEFDTINRLDEEDVRVEF